MSELDPPPVIKEPDGPPPQFYGPAVPLRKPSLTPWVTISAALTVGLVGLGSLVALILVARKPHFRAGMDRAIVAIPEKNGWSRYNIPALNLSISMNVKPTVAKIQEDKLASRIDIKEYAAYHFLGRHLTLRVAGYWMRAASISIDKLSEGEKTSYAKTVPTAHLVRTQDLSVDDNPARLLEYERPYKGRVEVIRIAMVVVGSTEYYIEGTYYKERNAWADQAYIYSLRSIRFG